MAGSIFGNIFRVSTFGESHGKGLGGVIDGCPAGVEIDEEFIQSELDENQDKVRLLLKEKREIKLFFTRVFLRVSLLGLQLVL